MIVLALCRLQLKERAERQDVRRMHRLSNTHWHQQAGFKTRRSLNDFSLVIAVWVFIAPSCVRLELVQLLGLTLATDTQRALRPQYRPHSLSTALPPPAMHVTSATVAAQLRGMHNDSHRLRTTRRAQSIGVSHKTQLAQSITVIVTLSSSNLSVCAACNSGVGARSSLESSSCRS